MFVERFLVAQKGRKLRRAPLLLQLIASVVIYGIAIPMVLTHLSFFLYQEIYFGIYGIPKIRFRDYMTFDHGILKNLNIVQRLNCVYCAYANAFAAWLKAIVNQTEVYSCAIKSHTQKLGQEHQKEFYEYKDFT